MFNIFTNIWDKIVEIGAKAFVATGVVAITASPTPIIKETPKEPLVEQVVIEEVVEKKVEEKKETPKVVEKVIYKTVEIPVVETPVVEETPKEEVKEELPLVNPNKGIFNQKEEEPTLEELQKKLITKQLADIEEQEEKERIEKLQESFDVALANGNAPYILLFTDIDIEIYEKDQEIKDIQNKSHVQGVSDRDLEAYKATTIYNIERYIDSLYSQKENLEVERQIEIKKLKDKYPDLF